MKRKARNQGKQVGRQSEVRRQQKREKIEKQIKRQKSEKTGQTGR